MARNFGTEPEIIDAVIAKIVADSLVAFPTAPVFTTANTRLCMDWDRPPMTSGAISCVVGPGDGNFEEDSLIGGGQQQATFDSSLIVAVYTPIRTDLSGFHNEILKEAKRGLWPLWKMILQSLVDFSPNDETNYFTRDPLYPTQRLWVKTMESKYFGFQQYFTVKYDVDLS